MNSEEIAILFAYVILFSGTLLVFRRNLLLLTYSFLWMMGHFVLSIQDSFAYYQGIYAFSGFIVSYCGMFLGSLFFSEKGNNHRRSLYINRIFVIMVLLVVAVTLFIYAQRLLQTVGIEYAINNPYILRWTTQYSSEFITDRLTSWVLNLPLAVFILIIASGYEKNRHTKTLAVVSFLVIVVRGVVSMAKLEISIASAALIFKLTRDRQYRMLAIALPVTIGMLIGLQMIRSSWIDKAEFVNSIGTTISTYAFSGIAAFEQIVKDTVYSYGLGQNTFMRFVNKFIDNPMNPYYATIYLPRVTNIYSWLREPFLDLGYPGIFIFSFVISFLFSIAKKYSRHITLRIVAIYIYVSTLHSAASSLLVLGILYVSGLEAVLLYHSGALLSSLKKVFDRNITTETKASVTIPRATN